MEIESELAGMRPSSAKSPGNLNTVGCYREDQMAFPLAAKKSAPLSRQVARIIKIE